MDVAAACSGFVYAYASAQAYITSGMAKHVLVIGAELLTRFLDYTDRSTCILFGDGAGAVVLSASDEPGGGLGIEMTTDPQGAYMIWLPAGGAKSPPSAETIARGEHYIRMEGKETYRFATKTMATTALETIRRSGLDPSDIALFIPHQANIRIVEAVAKGLGPADGADVREPRQVRQHLGRVRADRPGRGGQRGPGAGRRQRRARRVRGRASRAARSRSSGPPIPPAASPATPRSTRTTIHVRLPVDWDSVDPIPDALAAIMAQPGTGRRAARRRRPRRARARAPGGPRMIDLTGKSALVTGGSRGIGKAIGLRLATQGADVAFSYKGNAAAAARDGARDRGHSERRALADPGRRRGRRLPPTSVVKAALEAFGKIDILVNNAGITRDDLIMRMSAEAWREVLETNLFGAFWMTKAVTRPMLKARGGRIINITSVSGQAGQTGQANYSAAKAGLIGLTKATARELASRGITVNAVAPGLRPHRAHAGPAGCAQGRDHRANAARAVRDDRGGREQRSPSSRQTRRGTSRGRCWPSTAAS